MALKFYNNLEKINSFKFLICRLQILIWATYVCVCPNKHWGQTFYMYPCINGYLKFRCYDIDQTKWNTKVMSSLLFYINLLFLKNHLHLHARHLLAISIVTAPSHEDFWRKIHWRMVPPDELTNTEYNF